MRKWLLTIAGLFGILFPCAFGHASIVYYPWDVDFYSNPAVEVWGDYPPGWEMGSWQANGSSVTELYMTPGVLFGGAIRLGQIASISYWTKNPQPHSLSPPDWFITIYTMPFEQGKWYGLRLVAEPYLAENISEIPGQWVQWSTSATENKLRFFVSGISGHTVSSGSFAEVFEWGQLPPNWDDLRSAYPALPADLYNQQVKYIKLSTATGWSNGFTGQVDGLEIRLTNGNTARVNLEAMPEPGSIAAVLLGLGTVAYCWCRRQHQ